MPSGKGGGAKTQSGDALLRVALPRLGHSHPRRGWGGDGGAGPTGHASTPMWKPLRLPLLTGEGEYSDRR